MFTNRANPNREEQMLDIQNRNHETKEHQHREHRRR